MAFLPEFTLVNAVITVLQLLVLVSAGAQETKEPMGYSKFAQKVTLKREISSKTGMIISYVPALLYCVWDLGLPSETPPTMRWMAAVCLIIHFAKRTLEVLYVHVYSGRSGLEVMVPIGVLYVFDSAVILHSAGPRAELGEVVALSPRLVLGLAMFGVGQLGNLYHHILLARLRRPGQQGSTLVKGGPGGRYVLPNGGLFELVATPHYFCEITAWLGLALAVPRLNVLLAAVGMASYLAGRSAATTAWYKEQFGSKWPATRKHLVPFIY